MKRCSRPVFRDLSGRQQEVTCESAMRECETSTTESGKQPCAYPSAVARVQYPAAASLTAFAAADAFRSAYGFFTACRVSRALAGSRRLFPPIHNVREGLRCAYAEGHYQPRRDA